MVDRFPAILLDCEWGNPSGDDPFASAAATTTNELSSLNLIYPHHHYYGSAQNQSQHFYQHPHDPHLHQYSLSPSIYDPRAFVGASGYTHPFSPEHGGGHIPSGNYMVVPKSEPNCVVGTPTAAGTGGVLGADFMTAATIGLNLGGRTYFSASDDHDDFVNRLYRMRSRGGGGEAVSVNAPRCQAEGCNTDLIHAKHYHRRHKVCEFHSKAATVIAAGLTQRFCQQCSRFHPLNEFDNGKRSCRKRLADHNRRRRKSHQPQPRNSPSAGSSLAGGSPADSGAQSCSSVTVAAVPSPPRISLDCFSRQSGSLFYSKG